jgi:hypothetical protein
MLSDKKFKVNELKGIKSLHVLNAVSKLLLGLLMVPALATEEWGDFYKKILDMSEDKQRELLEKAVRFVELEESEVLAMAYFCEDGNGISYDKSSIDDLSPVEIKELCIEVALQVLKIEVFFCRKAS